ncbi:hypothetical protein CVT24_005903 [Panaeolus cyanescens]|uniref:Uncharacterized protein n=1 Tax=Panaeolus cyanescens TaxID=181874 RepID=A0A409VAZ6_9AGAR|nr:hypothetical protein CVT24_005903 [Panaeolus cyanescens]
MAELEAITPPQTLTKEQRELVFEHLFRKLATYRNTAVLYASLEAALCSDDESEDGVNLKRQKAFEDALNKWAQSLADKAWSVCHPDNEDDCPKLDPFTDTATIDLEKIPKDADITRILNTILFIDITSSKQYSARTRSFLSSVGPLFESGIVSTLRHPERALEEAQKRADDAKVSHAQKRKTLRMVGMGLGAVAGGVLVGVTGGLAAPLVGAGVSVVLGWLGVGGSVAGLLISGLAGSSVICGALFGAYGAKSTASMVAKHTKEITDLAIVPVWKTSQESDTLAVRLCVSGWLNDQTDITEPWKVFKGDGDTYALQWEMKALEELSSALYTLITSHAMKYVKAEIIKRTVFAGLMNSLAPLALLKIGQIIDNPWMNARALAIKGGKVLGDLLANRVFGNRPVTLVGYSLGSLLIFEALKYLAEMEAVKTLHIVEDVFLFGAPVPVNSHEWASVRRVVAGRVVNGYSNKDYVLAMLCRASIGSWNIAGLQGVFTKGVEDLNCEDVEGHLMWREMVGKYLKLAGSPEMSHPTPIQSLVGGLTFPVITHQLLLLNGNVFGISGFVHRAVKGNREGIAGVAGLIFGGILVAKLEGAGPSSLSLGVPQILLSGFLVGLGTKLANGCTSGHMICGLSRLSIRSLAATAVFFTTGVITTHLLHGDLPPASSIDWSFPQSSKALLSLQSIPFSLSVLLYFLNNTEQRNETESTEKPVQKRPKNLLRLLTYFATGMQFALALRLSKLSESSRVSAFLLLPFSRAFDPSLAFAAGIAIPIGMLLYRYGCGDYCPRLGGAWSVPKGGVVDKKLLLGSLIFGLGWGAAGICPGPGLLNFGRALGSGGQNIVPYGAWLGSMILGGLAADALA